MTPTLAKAWENVKVNNGSSVALGLENVLPYNAVYHDLLYQVDKIKGETVELLVLALIGGQR